MDILCWPIFQGCILLTKKELPRYPIPSVLHNNSKTRQYRQVLIFGLWECLFSIFAKVSSSTILLSRKGSSKEKGPVRNWTIWSMVCCYWILRNGWEAGVLMRLKITHFSKDLTGKNTKICRWKVLSLRAEILCRNNLSRGKTQCKVQCPVWTEVQSEGPGWLQCCSWTWQRYTW